MKISHEVPRCLLEESKKFNDYQYALVHLLEKDKEYEQHFLQCKEEGIPIYLDNSLHELGTAVGGDILLKWIEKLKPEHVFVPDVWGNANETLKNALEWSRKAYPVETTPIAIIQANTLNEAEICYQEYKKVGYEKIAFPYGSSYYNSLFPHANRSIGGVLGRNYLLNRLYLNGTIKKGDRIHLLGTYCAFEFGLYRGVEYNIESIDTSNPIMASIEGLIYGPMGLFKKPLSNLNLSFEIDKNDINLPLLYHNIDLFKQIIR